LLLHYQKLVNLRKMKSGGMSEGAATKGFGVEIEKMVAVSGGLGAAIKGIRPAETDANGSTVMKRQKSLKAAKII